GHHPPAEATVTLADITASLDPAEWEIVTAKEHQRPVPVPGGQTVTLHDVVVRATHRP
ncbi:SAM-dependent methyltransferase, partial [Escherichia coli]|nr:SAM-dependent methyltransferase [Escherichia coli]